MNFYFGMVVFVTSFAIGINYNITLLNISVKDKNSFYSKASIYGNRENQVEIILNIGLDVINEYIALNIHRFVFLCDKNNNIIYSDNVGTVPNEFSVEKIKRNYVNAIHVSDEVNGVAGSQILSLSYFLRGFKKTEIEIFLGVSIPNHKQIITNQNISLIWTPSIIISVLDSLETLNADDYLKLEYTLSELNNFGWTEFRPLFTYNSEPSKGILYEYKNEITIRKFGDYSNPLKSFKIFTYYNSSMAHANDHGVEAFIPADKKILNNKKFSFAKSNWNSELHFEDSFDVIRGTTAPNWVDFFNTRKNDKTTNRIYNFGLALVYIPDKEQSTIELDGSFLLKSGPYQYRVCPYLKDYVTIDGENFLKTKKILEEKDKIIVYEFIFVLPNLGHAEPNGWNLDYLKNNNYFARLHTEDIFGHKFIFFMYYSYTNCTVCFEKI